MCNERAQTYVISLDRPFEIKTTSMAVGAGQLPPMGVLTTQIEEGEELVLTPEGFSIRSLGTPEENDAN